MSFEHKLNMGSMFKNEKRVNEKQPIYTGDANVNGKVMRVAAWVNESKTGKKYLSLKFQEPDNEVEEAPPSQGQPVNLDDEIPF